MYRTVRYFSILFHISPHPILTTMLPITTTRTIQVPHEFLYKVNYNAIGFTSTGQLQGVLDMKQTCTRNASMGACWKDPVVCPCKDVSWKEPESVAELCQGARILITLQPCCITTGRAD